MQIYGKIRKSKSPAQIILLIFGSFAAAEGRAAGACGLNRFQLTSQSSAVKVKFYRGGDIPLGLHKVRVVQKLHLVPVERRMEAIREAEFYTFRLNTTDVFLDMLTDSGVNAMSDNQVAAMLRADGAYAAPRLHPLAYRLRDRPPDVALRQPRDDRRPALPGLPCRPVTPRAGRRAAARWPRQRRGR